MNWLKCLINIPKVLSFRVAVCVLLLSLLIIGYGVYVGLLDSPVDYLQGDLVRIMYVHVPAAWLSLMIYMAMFCMSFVYVVWRLMPCYFIARAIAPIGLCFVLICLVTGSIWGKEAWGTWWVWDARLTSMFVLFLLYLGYIMICSFLDEDRAPYIASIINIVGGINLPIIKFSVDMFNTLHQPASVFRSGGTSIHPDMMFPLLMMFSGFILFSFSIFLIRYRSIINVMKIKRLRIKMMNNP